MKNPWTLSRIFIRGSRIVSLEIRDNRVYNEGRDSRRLQSLVSTNVGTGTCKHMDHHIPSAHCSFHFFPCPSLLSRPHRGSTTPESNESCLHNSEWSKSTPRFRPRGCRVDSKGLEGIVHAFWKLLLLRTGFKFCGFEEEGSFFEENRFNFLRF